MCSQTLVHEMLQLLIVTRPHPAAEKAQIVQTPSDQPRGNMYQVQIMQIHEYGLCGLCDL